MAAYISTLDIVNKKKVKKAICIKILDNGLHVKPMTELPISLSILSFAISSWTTWPPLVTKVAPTTSAIIPATKKEKHINNRSH